MGRGVGEKAGDALKTTTLELGGKSPVIVHKDVDIDEAVEVRGQQPGFSEGSLQSCTLCTYCLCSS